ncbi:MAG: antibiotic biosynthesis monooxygenase [Gammaproteobacteria bacterium]|nr:antibiotic biosynthesis monooxygenase [Gammaproteobacteria bacterium]
MIAVIFEVEMKSGQGENYFELATELRPELEKIDGFISVERFESLVNPGKYVSLSLWRDEDAIIQWKCHLKHQSAQEQGKQSIFSNYRIRVANVIRDYGLNENS